MHIPRWLVIGLIIFLVTPRSVPAFELNEKLDMDILLTGVYQSGFFDNTDVGDKDRGATVADFGVNFHPTKEDAFEVTASYANGNALNNIVPVSLRPYDDDLEDDLKNINGRNRNYLLTANYKHTFTLSEESSLGITGGIIDSTEYLDINAFANDETSQFMNQAFVNKSIANFPTYDYGAAGEWEISKSWSLHGIWMNSKNDIGNTYNYYGGQLGYHIDSFLGEGNYRLIAFITDKKFPDPEETSLESLWGVGVSLDQKLTKKVGVFSRFGKQDDKAAVTWDALVSAGLNINGKLWKEAEYEAGLGYAFLDGPSNGDIDQTHAIETYIKIVILERFDITLDIQYIEDQLRGDQDPSAFIVGGRLNVHF